MTKTVVKKNKITLETGIGHDDTPCLSRSRIIHFFSSEMNDLGTRGKK